MGVKMDRYRRVGCEIRATIAPKILTPKACLIYAIAFLPCVYIFSHVLRFTESDSMFLAFIGYAVMAAVLLLMGFLAFLTLVTNPDAPRAERFGR